MTDELFDGTGTKTQPKLGLRRSVGSCQRPVNNVDVEAFVMQLGRMKTKILLILQPISLTMIRDMHHGLNRYREIHQVYDRIATFTAQSEPPPLIRHHHADTVTYFNSILRGKSIAARGNSITFGDPTSEGASSSGAFLIRGLIV